ncbi:MAG: hypothetical protein A2Y24_04935 [Clostridiales bacterium GWE2_32_10]|nr:MAG: hypothetical protein A2Y24_04935 [Clostridiales bacterium GWE2_32_10]HBY20291.1 hypothetical protein [Clostridiales bacterium]
MNNKDVIERFTKFMPEAPQMYSSGKETDIINYYIKYFPRLIEQNYCNKYPNDVKPISLELIFAIIDVMCSNDEDIASLFIENIHPNSAAMNVSVYDHYSAVILAGIANIFPNNNNIFKLLEEKFLSPSNLNIDGRSVFCGTLLQKVLNENTHLLSDEYILHSLQNPRLSDFNSPHCYDPRIYHCSKQYNPLGDYIGEYNIFYDISQSINGLTCTLLKDGTNKKASRELDIKQMQYNRCISLGNQLTFEESDELLERL